MICTSVMLGAASLISIWVAILDSLIAVVVVCCFPYCMFTPQAEVE